jgi:hypothetical protein
MPAGFDYCVSHGGKVRTVTMGGKRYVHYCFLGGKSFRGEVKANKKVLKGK